MLRSAAVLALMLSAGASLAPAQAALRVASAPAAGGARADSARLLRNARGAQAAFERVRLATLPWTSDQGSSGGTCDEVIGRFCFWYDDAQPDWNPPPEPPAVKQARDGLIATLDAAAAASPGDGWVAGQRVRYLVEAGRMDDAVRAARECRAERWWCLALDGYALHSGHDFTGAESAFAAALELLPPDVRRAWDDYALPVAAGDLRAIRRMAPAARAVAERRLWWLADPFWMDAGNDRKTEHYARLVADRFQDHARTTEGTFWADDTREILVRWGQPSGWERMQPRVPQTANGGIVTHFPNSFEFVPSLAMIRDPYAIEAADWKVDARRVYTQYAPPGVRRFARLPHQVAVFRRGGACEVVAAFAMKPDSLAPNPVLDAGVVVMQGPDSTLALRKERVAGTHGVLRVQAPPETAMVSVEAREPVSGRAARARFGIDLRRPESRGVSISDVLLLGTGDARPRSLDEAAPLARGNTDFRAGDRVSLYWEVYGVRAADTLTFSVALARRPGGTLRRLVESGLIRGATPVRLRWEEPAGADAIVPRSLGIALPRLSPGAYLLEVTVRTRSGGETTAFRELTILR